jgi:peptidoglycan/LPS O-acetylase OafA/YrhL
MSQILRNLGTLGVAVFFLLSGYNFGKTSKKTFKSFMKSKWMHLIIPWFFTGAIVYLYTALRKGSVHLWTMIMEIIGIDNYTWYILALFLLYIIYWRIKKNRTLILCVVLISAVVSPIQNLVIHPLLFGQGVYIFQFTWLTLFGIGLLMAQGYVQCKLMGIHGEALICVVMAVICVLSWLGIGVYYWSFYYPLLAIPFSCCIVDCTISPGFGSWVKTNMGTFAENSLLSMYLLHMPIAGIVARIFNRLYYSPIVVRPFLVIFITLFLIWIGKIVSEKLHVSKMFYILTGFRGR